MSFADELGAWPRARVMDAIERARTQDVEAALAREMRGPEDLCALLSPCARAFLEPMAREASRLNRWQFGRTSECTCRSTSRILRRGLCLLRLCGSVGQQREAAQPQPRGNPRGVRGPGGRGVPERVAVDGGSAPRRACRIYCGRGGACPRVLPGRQRRGVLTG